IDANCIVIVSAKDLGTGKEQKITITASTNLSQDEIDNAVKEAERFAAEDKKHREEIDIKNHADQLVYQTEKLLSENGDKFSDEDKAAIQAEIDALKNISGGTDFEAIKAQTEALEKKMYELSAKMYQAAGGQGAPNPDDFAGYQQDAGNAGNPGGAAGGQYYDADYTVVDDDKDQK
ncbi:MAG: Hsp70 family protein, partial [Clostridia bacterium]|nr:Hsp70 family protein [Clostridia bacterium]